MNNQARNQGSGLIGGIFAFLIGLPIVIFGLAFFVDHWFYIVGILVVLLNVANVLRLTLDNHSDDL